MNELDIAVNNLTEDMRYGRRAISWRGGEISATAGFREIVTKIPSLPASSSIGTVEDDSRSIYKDIPVDSIEYCYLKSIGGMTYKCENLMPFPYYGVHGEMQIGVTQALGGLSVVVNSDKSLSITKEVDVLDDSFRLDISGLTTSDYYLTVLYNGADFFGVSSNVGNIPFNTSVFIPSTIGITYIDIYSTLESEGHGTISIILSKEPYFEGLSDTKTTAVKAYGANCLPFPYYSNAGTSNGITVTINDDRSITFDGTATDKVIFYLKEKYSLRGDVDYYISANCIRGNWPTGLTLQTSVGGLYTSLNEGRTVDQLERGTTAFTLFVILAGTVCDNVTFKPMLSINEALPYKDYIEPIIYSIPEALQVSKGIEGAVDTVDFFNDKKDIKCKTTELGNVNYAGISQPFSGFVRGFYYATDFNIALRSKALCSRLPITSVFNGSEMGVCLQNMSGGNHYISVTIPESYLTDIEGANTSEKFKNWLNQNNVTLTYALAEPIVTPLPISTFVNLFSVEGGGYLEFVTDNGRAPNSNVRFQTIV